MEAVDRSVFFAVSYRVQARFCVSSQLVFSVGVTAKQHCLSLRERGLNENSLASTKAGVTETDATSLRNISELTTARTGTVCPEIIQ